MPIHGEWRHLRANADLAIRTGVDPGRAIIAEDGSVIDLVGGRATITGTVPAGLVYVDAMTVGGATEDSLKVRRNLAEEGVVTIVAIVDRVTGKLTEKPDFLAHGFEQDHSTFETAVPVIQKVLTTATKEGTDPEQIEALISQAVATWAFRKYRRSPLIIPVIIDA